MVYKDWHKQSKSHNYNQTYVNVEENLVHYHCQFLPRKVISRVKHVFDSGGISLRRHVNLGDARFLRKLNIFNSVFSGANSTFSHTSYP